MNQKIKIVFLDLFKIGVILFKFGVIVILFIVNIIFYLTYISVIGFILLIINSYLIFKIFTVRKLKWFVVFLLEFVLYFSLFNYLPSQECGVFHIYPGLTSSCVCLGITTTINDWNSGYFYSRCIGKRSKCYYQNTWFREEKKEIPCE